MIYIRVVETLKNICSKLAKLIHRQVKSLHQFLKLYLVDVFSSTGIGDSRLSHPNIKFNSLCTFSTIYCAACGNSAASSLGILLQQLPFGGSCATTNNVSMSITYPLLNSDASITVIEGTMTNPTYHNPNIETNQFIVNCSK